MKMINNSDLRTKLKKAGTKAVLGLTVSLCVMGTAIPVFANTDVSYGTGQIEVDNAEDQVTTFKAYKIFNANKNADGTVSNIQWPSTTIKNTVISVINEFDSKYSSSNAQDAADFISDAYKNASGQLTTDQTTILENAELLNRIAAAVDDTAVTATLTAGKATTLSEGYWLIVTDGNSVDVDEDGTSPIFTISSGEKITINEKTSIPTVDKVVLNDAIGATWTYGAEAERGQSVQHKVTGTVASNIKTYDSYYYEFEDVMSAGIDYDNNSFKVTLDGVDVTSSFTQKYTENSDKTHKLSIACTDLKKITAVTAKGGSTLVLTYRVKLNDSCVVGSAGNPNDVRIIYSSNPNTSEKSATHTVRDYLYTFSLHLEKKDRDTNVSLEGAKFTIEATNPDDASSKGLFVQKDGRLGTTAYEFTTDADGVIDVSGLDAGTYTLHETKCPDMYQVVNKDTVFTIAATYNADGTIKTLTNTVSGNADACAGTDSTNDNTVNGDKGTAANVNACLVSVTVGNIEKIKMPLSGQEGITLMVCAGIGMVGISVAGLFVAKKKKKAAGC